MPSFALTAASFSSMTSHPASRKASGGQRPEFTHSARVTGVRALRSPASFPKVSVSLE